MTFPERPWRSGAAPPPGLLFVHGWGFGPGLWDDLRGRLPPGQIVDLGYGGRRQVPVARPVVGVGHSFGGLWLLRQLRADLAGLVLINGFGRFTAGEDWPHGQPARVLERMRRAFALRPRVVLDDFRARCGAAPWQGSLHIDALADDLEALAAWDERPALAALDVPCLCLAAADDPLVGAGASIATAALAGAQSAISAEGGHLLPLSRPDWCAETISAFLA